MRGWRQIGLIGVFACLATGALAAGCGPHPVRIAALGTSLTAGFGLPSGAGYIDRLQTALRAQGCKVTIENAGVSGDTSAGGLARLDWTLAAEPQIVIVELGANDALRGLAPKETEKNLDAILSKLDARKMPTLFMGMFAPPNLGKDYGSEFEAVFPRLAKKHGVTFYPFVLDGIAADLTLNQADGIHPNAKGAAIMAERILPVLMPLVVAASNR